MRILSLLLGILVLAICLGIPLPALDANSPFSSHMLRHTSLMLLAAPLMALAISPAGFAKKQLTAMSRLTNRLPFAAWLTGVAVMWIWHVPGWYNSITPGADTISCAPLAPALFSHLSSIAPFSRPLIIADRVFPLLNDLSLLIAGFIFWWPVITPCHSFRLSPLRGVAYLASACICCSLLGLLITFARPGVYRGISLSDQQTGGMIMWIPCCLIYLTASMGLLIEWLSKKEADTSISIQNHHA
ncbi:MAG TPA: cytochrome c oxidase assembly protein [Puia sp.]|jgi:cytochrome c oxidase assembly factor CtaG|nr:cytochrome c oxidase assembly protein [Puia sp.]